MNAPIGTLRAELGIDGSEWADGILDARSAFADFVREVGQQFAELERTVRRIGVGLTAGITAPFAALVVSSTRSAGSFEAAINRVEAALRGIEPRQLQELSRIARRLGPDVGRNAIDAAEGIETLALAGLNADQIIGGGLEATLEMAAANLGSVEESAALVTDVMAQFGRTTRDLPHIVNLVTGALDVSKLAFRDYQLAIGQSGGAAAGAGVDFRDLNTAIAAIAPSFDSGSSAGTSFRTFITRLAGDSEEARRIIDQLNLSFYDSQGRLKSLADIAGELQRGFSGLADEARVRALTALFGQDAMTTAIALMERGREGIIALQETIDQTDAGEKLAIQQQGLTAALNRVSAAWLNLKIAIGETGLLELATSLAESLARLVQRLSDVNPTLLRLGLILGALASTLGPLMILLGTIGSFLVAKFVASFGLIGRAVAFVIAPIATLVETLGGLIASVGVTRALGAVAGALARLLGPVGWAVTAFFLLRDSIVPVLRQLWDVAVETLGPPLAALLRSLSDLFGEISNGPIGAALSWLMTALSTLLEVVGTIVAGIVRLLGGMLITTLEEVIRAFIGVVDVITNVVRAINALLSGDFAGAWEAAVEAVDSAVGAIISAAGAIMPGLGPYLRDVYDGLKEWLIDGFAEIGQWFADLVNGSVDTVASIFPGIVDAARAVYQGVKQWLVDAFGPILDWVGRAARWIRDQYNSIRQTLGLGGGGEAEDAPGAPSDAPVPTGRRAGGTSNPDFGGGRSRRGRQPRDRSEEIAYRRELLALEQSLAVARARGDQDQIRRIEREIDLRQRVKQYRDLELDAAAALAAAQRDMTELAEAEAVLNARTIAIQEDELDLELARTREDFVRIEQLERQASLRERTTMWQQRGLTLAEAERRAAEDLAQIDAARLELRERLVAEAERERAVELARLSGESETSIRRLERAAELERRTREIAEREGVNDEVARERATLQLDEEERARLRGDFRLTFRDGVRAALDGDLKGFIKNWWTERLTRSLEDALNNVADLLFNLISGQKGGGGGFFGALFGGFGGALGSPGGIKGFAEVAPAWQQYLPKFGFGSLPGLVTGGTITVGGPPGIDKSVLSLNGAPIARVSKGEDISVANGGRRPIIFDLRGAVMTEDLLRQMEALADGAAARGAAGGVAMTMDRLTNKSRRRMGRG